MRYADEHGESKQATEHIDLPADLANGLILTLLKNVRSTSLPKIFASSRRRRNRGW